MRDVCADHSNPPMPQEQKEEHETRVKYPQLGWHSQQLYQVLALTCKGEALAMVKALAAGEYERHARSDRVVSVDSRPPWIQCATNPWIGWTSFSTSTLSENGRHSKLR